MEGENNTVRLSVNAKVQRRLQMHRSDPKYYTTNFGELNSQTTCQILSCPPTSTPRTDPKSTAEALKSEHRNHTPQKAGWHLQPEPNPVGRWQSRIPTFSVRFKHAAP